MKKIILTFFIVLCVFLSNASASDRQRMLSSGIETESAVLINQDATLYGVQIMATTAPGFVLVYDSDDTTTTGDVQLIEISESTLHNSKYLDLGEHGIKAREGLYFYLYNASAIFYYYY